MKRPFLPVILAGALGTACSAHTMFYADPSRFTVTSTPSGATVYVMGNAIGVTPLEIRKEQVFPATYPPQLQSEYGFVTLEYQGCGTYRNAVHNKTLENGLDVTLKCSAGTQPAAISLPGQQTASTPTPSTRQRLQELKSLYEDGLITEQEYNERRKAILSDL